MTEVAQSNGSLLQKVEQLGHAVALVALAALTSPVSQHVLTPVFGSLPSSINHKISLPFSFLLGFILHGFSSESIRRQYIQLVPVLSILIIGIGDVALLCSEQLGLIAGPIVAGLISCHIIVVSAAFAAASSMSKIRLGNWSNGLAASLANASIALLPFVLLEQFFSDQVPQVLAGSSILVPVYFQVIIGRL